MNINIALLREMSIFGVLILLYGFTIIILSVVKAFRISNSSSPKHVGLIGIWLFGVLAFLIGWLGRLVGTLQAMDAIQMAGNISPSIVAEGIGHSMKSVIFGMLVLIVAVSLWGILKGWARSVALKNAPQGYIVDP